MQYITAKPRALTATETRLLATITAERWWLPEPKCLTYDDLEALEFLRYLGMIEKAAYGGYKIKAGSVKPAQTPADTVRAILRKHGITPDGDILPCKSAWAWSPNCWAFVLPRGVVIGDAKAAFKKCVVDQRVCIVEMKGN